MIRHNLLPRLALQGDVFDGDAAHIVQVQSRACSAKIRAWHMGTALPSQAPYTLGSPVKRSLSSPGITG